MGNSKEQYDLVLSGNGSWAAFAERNWGELTYLVIVDREAKRREQMPFYGSFPAWFGDTLLFASDPDFVRTEDPSFRQIENFAVYAYRPRTNSLCRVAAALSGAHCPLRSLRSTAGGNFEVKVVALSWAISWRCNGEEQNLALQWRFLH